MSRREPGTSSMSKRSGVGRRSGRIRGRQGHRCLGMCCEDWQPRIQRVKRAGWVEYRTTRTTRVSCAVEDADRGEAPTLIPEVSLKWCRSREEE